MTENIDLTSENSSTVHQITTFEDAAAVSQQFFPDQTPVAAEQLVHISEDRDHTTKDFLKREYAIWRKDFTPGGSQGDVIHTFELPRDLMLASTQTSKKADGFTFMRGTVILRAVVAAHPDSQGGIMLVYIPDIAQTEVDARSQIALQQSQHSHVVINVNDAESRELSVPYLSPYDAISLNNPQSRNGYVKVCLLTPLAGNTSITIFARFADDLMLEHPTPMPIASSFSLAAKRLEEFMERVENSDNPKDLIRMIKDSKNLSVLHTKTESQKQNDEGIISGITGKLSQITRVASGLPIVGNLASMATPILDIGTNLAKTFGFSKPNQDKPTVPNTIRPFNDHLSAEGIRNPATLNYHFNNTVETKSGEFGTDIDEMAVETIARREQLIPLSNTTTIGSFSTSTAARTVIAAIPLNPCEWWLRFADLDDKLQLIPTHFMWLFSFFRFWSADFVFNVRFFLTAFHKVQIRFAFVPGALSDTNFSNLDYNAANSSVIPIHSENSIHSHRINCLRNVQKMYTANFNLETIAHENTIGYFVILLETQLVATSSVSPTVHFTVFGHLENVELCVPAVNNVLYPMKFGVTDSSKKKEKKTLGELSHEPHMFSVRTHDTPKTQAQVTETGSIGATTSTSSEQRLISSQVATGECTESLRQIGNCYTLSASLPIPYDDTKDMLYDPGAYTEATNIYFPAASHDLIDSIAAPYAFRKGGYNVRIIPHNVDLSRRLKVWLSDYQAVIRFGEKFQVVTQAAETHLAVQPVSKRVIPVSTVLERGVEVHVPFNQPTSKVLVNQSESQIQFKRPAANRVAIHNNDFHTGDHSQPTYVDFFRSFAEDTKYGCLMALPIMARYKRDYLGPN